MRYSTFLLDLDHTLFDSDTSEEQAFAHTMHAANVEDAERYRQTYREINLALWARVERHELTPQQVRGMRFEQLVREERIDADPEEMAQNFVAALGANGELYEGVREVLDRLNGRVSLALVTNGLSEVQRARIERLDIDRYFDAVVISAEVGTAKPGSEIFDITFEALDFPDKNTAVMVGDNLSSDIRGGVGYGIAACWYNPQGRAAESPHGAAHEITDMSELLGLVAL